MGETAGRWHVVDCHHHVGSVKGALGLGEDGEAAAAEELRIRLETMDRNGVDQAIIIPGHAYLRPHGMADTRAVNDAIAAYRDATPGRFPAAVGIVEPLYGPAGLDELTRISRELGLAGVSFHTRFQGVSTDSPLTRRLIGRMAELGLVPFLHALAEISDEAPWRMAAIARDFPDLPMLVVDAFSSMEQCQQLMLLGEIAPNLLFDTSLVYTFDLVLPFIRKFGAGRVVYGSDLYSHPLGYRRTHVLQQIREADLSDQDKAQILSGNITRLLGLPGAI
jgi:predicted TIM-barrel fold metal-dependent hydrolase